MATNMVATQSRRSHSGSARSAASSISAGRSIVPVASVTPHHAHGSGYGHPTQTPSPILVEALVDHLLSAKNSLSTMTAVVRATEILTAARVEHEDAAIRMAQAGFVRRVVIDQAGLLDRVRRSLGATYESRRRRFTKLIHTMDTANTRLQASTDMLRGTAVLEAIRPHDDQTRNLLDFVDQKAVCALQDAMKKSLSDLQAAQQSFDGDLLRLDTDIRALRKALSAGTPPQPVDNDSMPDLLASLTEHSQHMGSLLTALTRHFDLCVTAVRITDGGTAVARRRAAEDSDKQAAGSGSGDVSISGVIAEQESHRDPSLDPHSMEERDEMMRVVVSDAAEVEDVVSEIRERLAIMEDESSLLRAEAARTRASHAAVLAAHRILEEVEPRLSSYVDAEHEFISRWNIEQNAISDKLTEMSSLHDFYQTYATAYGSLVLEVERRRTVEEKIEGIWRKAHESVDRLVEADWKQREAFRQEAGHFLPGDLWAGVQNSTTRWEVTPIQEGNNPEDGGTVS